LVANKIKDNPKVKLLSHSFFPDLDNIEVLYKYPKVKGVIGNVRDI
jgi:protein SCO1/2